MLPPDSDFQYDEPLPCPFPEFVHGWARKELHDRRRESIEPLFAAIIRNNVLVRLFSGELETAVLTAKGLVPLEAGWWWGPTAERFILDRRFRFDPASRQQFPLRSKGMLMFVRTSNAPMRIASFKAERECQGWLVAQMRSSPNRRPFRKQHYLDQARKKLGKKFAVRSFNAAWKKAIEVTGAKWSKPGAPKKS